MIVIVVDGDNHSGDGDGDGDCEDDCEDDCDDDCEFCLCLLKVVYSNFIII